MSVRIAFGTLASEQRVGAELPREDTPLRIAVLGDFSGRGTRGEVGTPEEIGRRRARKVDRAGLDEVMAKLAPAATVANPPTGAPIAVGFRTLDEFHPDAIHGRVDAFGDCFDRDEKAALMTAILRDPGVRALESAWRGIDWLLQGVARSGAVEVRLIDISPAEIVADLASSDRLEETGLYQVLVDQPASRGELDPWSVLVGLHTFDPAGPEVETLGRLARISRQASAPFVSGVDPRVLDPKFALDESGAESWEALRRLPESALLGLATPRFLLRAPYGEDTRSIDAFDYEEYQAGDGPEGYLWGNPALAVAVLLARSYAKEGWKFAPGGVLDLSGLAMHVTKDEDGDPVSVVAEATLFGATAERISALGLMPVLSVKGRDAAELGCIQSLAKPPKGQRTSPLLGRWGQQGSVVLPGAGPTPAAPSPTPAPSAAPVAPVAAAPTPAPEEEVDAELAALMAELEAPAAPPAPAEEIDPELAAMMAELEGMAPEPEETPAEEIDPELAAMMAELEGAAPASAEAPAEEMDPELAAMMAELEAPPAADVPAEEMDPELAAMMAELEGTGLPADGSA